MIILLGIAGSGKTTQAERLAKALDCPWFSMGQLLRDHATAELKAQQARGVIVDDDLALPILETVLRRERADRRELILDGFPRTGSQAAWLLSFVKGGGAKITAVIHLKAPQELVLERLLRRGRSDDTESAIKTRFEQQYFSQIQGVIRQLEAAGCQIRHVDAAGTREDVTRRILEALGEA